MHLFNRREMNKNMTALQNLGSTERHLAANDLALTNELIRNSHQRHLQFFLHDATRSRQASMTNGANGRNFGSWLVPAVNETLLQCALVDGRGSKEFATGVTQVDGFVRTNTSQSERDAATQKARNILADLDRV